MVIDTHIWIWWMTGAKELSKKAIDELESVFPRPVVSDISLWEVAMLVSKGRIALDRPLQLWLEAACSAVRVMPVTPGCAARVALLPVSFHGDPADRLIVATALDLGLPLVTSDLMIRRSGCVKLMDLPS